MKDNLRKDIWIIVLMAASTVGILLIYSYLPMQIPVHWDINGDVDRYGNRINIIYLGLIPIIIYILFLILPVIDPRRKNYDKHKKAYRMTKYGVILLMTSISWITILYTLEVISDITRLLFWMIGIIFLLFGNYMRQIRSNFFFGIRNPWTLSNDVVWKKTHRLGGITFVLTGIGIILGSFFGPIVTFIFLMTGIVAILFVSTLYSYLVYNKENKKTGN